MNRRFGALHTPAPPEVPYLSARSRMDRMGVPRRGDWFAECPPDGDMLGNDVMGNCVPVANLRLIEVWGGVALLEDAVARYTYLTGYDPATGLPDDGTDTAKDMLNWAAAPIVSGGRDWPILWTVVSPRNQADLAIALSATPILTTLLLPEAVRDDPEAWQRPPGTGPGWEPQYGHRVLAGKFDAWTRWVRTWGEDVQVHPDFWAAYAVACDVPILITAATTLTISGLEYRRIEADMRLLTAVA